MATTHTGWPRLMRTEVAAAYLGISPQTLDRLRQEKKIAPRKLRGATRYHIGDLDEFADELPEVDPT